MLAQRQDIGALTDAVRRAQEAGVDFSQGFIHYGPEMIYRQGTLHPEEALPLLKLAKDPGDRRKWMEDYLTRWAEEDPNGVNACLPRIKDEDLRESIRAKVEAAAIR
ncbi:MAG: hypothetical protein JWO82_3284 [Akkermansiaceae bacterium]|nr:hypothetical protein [Akkermansiaceae bacterium]